MNRRQFEIIARKKNDNPSLDARGILNKVNERIGQCPCRIDGTACPCPHPVRDVKDSGSCHGGPFLEK